MDDSEVATLAAVTALKLAKDAVAKVDGVKSSVATLKLLRGRPGKPGADGVSPPPPIKGTDYNDGEPGPQGIGISEIEDKGSDFLIMLSDGRRYTIPKIKGIDGDPGTDGEPGADGVGVTGAVVFDGVLYLDLSSGARVVAGYVKGDKGDEGDPGKRGLPGQAPAHQVRATNSKYQLRFKNPDGSWGKWIEIPRKQTYSVSGGGGGPQVSYPVQPLVVRASVTTVLSPHPRILVKVDTSGGDVEIVLPAQVAQFTMEIIVKKMTSDTNKVIIRSETGALINELAEFHINYYKTATHFFDDGVEWDAV